MINNENRRFPRMDGAGFDATIGTTASAAATITGGPSASIPPGYYTFQATGGDIGIIFGTSASMGAPTLTANRVMIPQNTTIDLYLGVNVTHYRAIATASACTLSGWRSS